MPIVALVGRPNVGKSTLFNRLIGEHRAVVHEKPGTTRDRLYGTSEWRDREFTVIDTGGIGLDTGDGDLLAAIVDWFPKAPPAEEVAPAVSIAIVGRPNVGKSSLVNRLVGSPRSIVRDDAGTTRDAIDSEIERDGQKILLIDTAGIRRRGRVQPGVEKFSVMRAVRAIERADVAVLLIDATEGVLAQDAHVAGYVDEAAKGLVVAVNKWDLVEKHPKAQQEYTVALRRELKFADWAPVIYISAKTGQRVDRVISQALA